jgi:hypothetical protein
VCFACAVSRRVGSALLCALSLLGLAAPAALAAPPTLERRPVILGPARPGATLTIDKGTWTSATNTTYAFQWQRCDARGRGCTSIRGAKGRVWDVFQEDRGRAFRVRVLARNRTQSRSAVTAARRVIDRPAAKAGAAVTVAAVGDLVCSPAQNTVTATTCQHGRTAQVVAGSGASDVLLLGDIQYECGDPEEFAEFDATWGPLKPLIHPVPGNHEYQNKLGLGSPARCAGSVAAPGAGYFGYFGAAAGTPGAGYYSFDLGAWHLVALNANCAFVACAAGSPQERWLRADLAATRQPCILAYWHQPRFTAEGPRPYSADYRPFWNALTAARADIVLNGHVHEYQRLAALRADGRRSSTGVRQFIVGTGGHSREPGLAVPESDFEVHVPDTFGALVLKLAPTDYSWNFASTDGRAVDRGSDACRR